MITVLEKKLTEKVFTYRDEEVRCHSLFKSLYHGKHLGDYPAAGSDGSHCYVPLNSLPSQIKRHFDDSVRKSIITRLKVNAVSNMIFAPPAFEPYFVQRMREIFQNKEYNDYKKLYADYDYFTSEQITDKSMVHAVFVLMFPFYQERAKLKFMFSFLEKARLGIDLPLSTEDALRKLIGRKLKKGLPQALVHGGIGKPSNNAELTPLMKNIIIVLSVEITTSKSAHLIKEDLDIILNNLPNAKECGVYSVSERKIADYLKLPEADVAIRYAKDEPLEFRRAVTGIMRFSRPSAPLVRVCVDGYSFQVKYFNLEINEADFPVGIFFYDDRSDYVISMEIGVSENSELLMTAFKQFLIKTGYSLPRELVMDKFTYKLLKKNKKLLKFLEDNGVNVIKSPNPNRKNRLERFFETFQQLMLAAHIIEYLGPGVRSKFRNAHPFRSFKVFLSKNLPTKFELFPILKRLVRIKYNTGYKSREFDGSPECRFETEKKNPVATFDEDIVPYLCDELHTVKFWGASLVIRRGDDFHFYYKREFEFLLQYTGIQVDAYFDKSDPCKINVYEKDSKKRLCVIPRYEVIPVSLFDRTVEQHEFAKNFLRETLELIDLHKHYLHSAFETVKKALKGKDIYKYTKMALEKKAQSTEAEARNELEPKDERPPIKAVPSNQPPKRNGKEANLKKFGVELVSTI